MSFLAAFIMRGRMQAIMLASLLAWTSPLIHPLITPFVIIVSFATIALVALRNGALEGLYVWFCATVIASLGGLLIGGNGFLMLMAFICLMTWIPAWLIAVVLRETRQIALAIECAVFVVVLGVIGFYVYAEDPAKIWQDMFSPFLQMLPADAPVEEIREQLIVRSHFMTGIFATGILLIALFGLFLARWWQSVLYNPGGFKQEFLSLRTGSRLAIATITIIATAKLTSGSLSELASNIAMLLFVLYLFIGTSVLHTVCSTMKQSKQLIPMLYIAFFIPYFSAPFTIAVALVGLCDAWFNLRKIQSTSAR